MKARIALVLVLLAVLLPSASGAQYYGLLDNLVAYWPLDEAGGVRYDVHGNLDLTDNNTVGSTAGLHGLAASFVMTNSEYLSTSVIVPFLPFTVVAWVRFDNLYAGARILGNYDTARGLWLRTDPNALTKLRSSFRWGDQLQTFTLSNDTAIDKSQWTMVVVSASTAGLTVCHNMACQTTGPDPNAAITGASPFHIGTFLTGGVASSFLDGQVDEVGLWSRVLSTDELEMLYNDGAGFEYERFGHEAPPIEAGDLADVSDATGEIFAGGGLILTMLLGLILGIGIVVFIMKMFKAI